LCESYLIYDVLGLGVVHKRLSNSTVLHYEELLLTIEIYQTLKANAKAVFHLMHVDLSFIIG